MLKDVSFNTCRATVNEKLASSESSNVYKAHQGTQEVVVKLVSTQTTPLQMSFRRERNALMVSRGHSNIVQLLDSKLPGSDQIGGFMLEWCSRGTVKQWMQQAALTDAQITRILKEALSALQHLTQQDILHRDIQPDNLLLTASGDCKLADFGSSIAKSEWNSMTATQRRDDLQHFTQPHLRAPEQFDHRPQVGAGVDMWGLGCLLYGLLFYENAFSQYNLEDQLAGRYRAPKKPVAGWWLDILARLFEVNPAKRAVAGEVLSMLETAEVPRPVESSGFSSWRKVFNKSTSSWLQSATVNTDTPPDPAAFQKILAKAWAKPFKIQKFYKLLCKRQIQKTIIVIKSVLLLHMYLASGPPAVFKQETGALSFLTSVEQAWGSKAKKDVLYSEYFAGLVRQYCSLLKEKVRLQDFTDLDGAWTGGEVTDAESFSNLLNYWGKCLNFIGPLLRIETDLPILRVQVAAAMYSEAQHLAVLLTKGFCLMLERSTPDMEGFLELYHQNYKTTQTLFEELQPKGLGLRALPARALSQVDQLYETARRDSPDLIEVKGGEFSNLVDLDTASKFQSCQVDLPDSPAEEASPTKEPFWKQVDSRWLISAQDLQCKEPLGEGSSCIVYRGLYKRTEVAIKVMRAHTVSNSILKEFEREVSAMLQLRHPNIVLFMGICVERDLAIVSEFCSGGSLFRLLHDRRDIELSWPQRMKILRDIARGVLYLHEMQPPLIHRDLKSLNVLLQDEVRTSQDSLLAKVTDFGVTRNLDESATMTGQMGTCHWMAPEVLASQPYSLAADVYSYGIMAWEIAARKTPYKHLNPISIPYLVVAKGERPDVTEVERGCPQEIVELMKDCWAIEARERPSFSMILDRLEGVHF
jgi:serine/threonine protein kinase